MNENTGNNGNDFFFDVLDNPAALSHSNAFNLQLLINDFPQSGLLRSMLAIKQEAESLQSASAYVNPKLLYKAANTTNSLRVVTEDQIAIIQKPENAKPLRFTTDHVELPNIPAESNYFHVPIGADVAYIDDEENLIETEDETETHEEENVEANANIHAVDTELPSPDIEEEETEDFTSPAENHRETASEDEAEETLEEITDIEAAPLTDESETDVEAATNVIEQESGEEEEQIQTEPARQEAEEEVEREAAIDAPYLGDNEADAELEISRGYDEYLSQTGETLEPQSETAENSLGGKPIEPHQEIEDDVYEEIVSIEDIGLEQLAIMDKTAVKADEEQPDDALQGEPEHIAAEDNYFVFEPAIPEDEVNNNPSANITAQYAGGAETESKRVSRYNDEKMPYSFMWWLDKTRKEHAAIYQPFVVDGKFHSATVRPSAEKQQPAADSLQQQYIENIFTVTAVVSDLNVTPPKVEAPPVETREDKIIERFIHEEPQIKHPTKAKLDNENKAKKSSEDRDELVTETLAKIYTEQMLYHKAILTYKKLMLKFPEKSLYFAGQIETLEKKIN